MMKMIIPVSVAILVFCGGSFGADDRWDRIGEDANLVYYLDGRSVLSLNDDFFSFRLKLVDKKSVLKKRYRNRNLHHVVFHYELDCRATRAGVRTVLFFDSNNRQIDLRFPPDREEYFFEQIVPEGIMEKTAEMICNGELDDSVDSGVNL